VGLFILIMSKTHEEEMEEMQGCISQHEEILSLLVSALFEEENLSEDSKDAIEEAHRLLYGWPKKR